MSRERENLRWCTEHEYCQVSSVKHSSRCSVCSPAGSHKVVDHTTRERSLPLVVSLARPVAANRAWRLRAAAEPMSTRPIRSRGKFSSRTAPITSSPPRTPTIAPVDRENRRPRAAASRARGMAKRAAPRVPEVASLPDQAWVPENSTMSRAPGSSWPRCRYHRRSARRPVRPQPSGLPSRTSSPG